MRDLLVIVPSRGRQKVVHDLAQTFFGNSSGEADLLIGLDNDDFEYDIPMGYGERLFVETNERLRLGGTLNLLATKYADRYKNIGFMGDDHRPRTPGWDGRFVAELTNLETGLVYGNDLIWGAGLPTEIAMTSDIVQKLGYMVPPGMIHMYLDNFWLELGKKLDSITYLDDVIIEHLHPSVGKAEWTPEYKETNNDTIYNHDRELFEKFMAEEMDNAVSRVLA